MNRILDLKEKQIPVKNLQEVIDLVSKTYSVNANQITFVNRLDNDFNVILTNKTFEPFAFVGKINFDPFEVKSATKL